MPTYKIRKRETISVLMGHEEFDDKGHYIQKNNYDSDGNCLICAIDQFSGQQFMLNENGFITNDIMAFEEAQSDSVARAILSRMEILHPENAPADANPDKLLRDCLPANLSSPAEFIKYQKFIAVNWYKEQKALAEKQAAEKNKINFEETD